MFEKLFFQSILSFLQIMGNKSTSGVERTGGQSSVKGDDNNKKSQNEGQNEKQNEKQNEEQNKGQNEEQNQEQNEEQNESNIRLEDLILPEVLEEWAAIEAQNEPIEGPIEGAVDAYLNAQNEEIDSFQEEIAVNHWCDLCKRVIAFADMESHLIECTSKPYNEDVLTADCGECLICLDELEANQLVARLPCLCVYHIHCIQSWFRGVRACPQHPKD